LIGFTYTVKWVPGKTHVIADALSRAPVFQPEEEESCDILVRSMKLHEEKMDPALKVIVEAASSDIEYQNVLQVLKDRKCLDSLPKGHVVLKYRSYWDGLSFDESYGFLLYHSRIFVPMEARMKILKILHLQHTGIEKTLRNARQLYFWPKMKHDVARMISSCEECLRLLPSLALESQIQTVASRPFEFVSVDLGKQDGTDYLILADRYSGWPLVAPLRCLNTKAVISALENWFLDYGKPLNLRSDGGPQFRGEFKEWCATNKINHELSSPYHHESNGHAECSVREMKHLLEKTRSFKNFRHALLEWRNTPRYDGLSPAQWLFGRRQRTEVPALPNAYERIDDSTIKSYEARREEIVYKKKEHTDKRSKTLRPLEIGSSVLIQHPQTKRWDQKGTVVSARNQRSYVVESKGKKYVRNRIFLRPNDHSKREVTFNNSDHVLFY
ncbi:Uncharacterized protein FKW44_009103, partial [Caligus rogercresseyi]